MRKYNAKTLTRFYSSCIRNRILYKPFKGRCPVRINITVSVLDHKRGKWLKRFSYQGKYSWAAITKAKRVQALMKLKGEEYTSNVTEYHRNGTIYQGDLTMGNALYGHNFAHFGSLNGQTRNHTMIMWGEVGEEIPVTCGEFVMLVPKRQVPNPSDKEAWKDLHRRMRVQMRRNEES